MNATYSLLHRDDQLLVVDKAPGVLTVGNPRSRQRCLLDDLRRDGHAVAPVHRLDRETSGVLLLCLDPAVRADLELAFRERDVTKHYLALVHGRPKPERAQIDLPILDAGATARVDRRGRSAVTRYEVLETFDAAGVTAALLRLEMLTGRHNQIRVHLAHIGHPLLGDDKYGRRPRGSARLAPRCMLHAEQLALRHPRGGRRLSFRAPPPDDFERCRRRLDGEDG